MEVGDTGCPPPEMTGRIWLPKSNQSHHSPSIITNMTDATGHMGVYDS